MKKIYQKIIAMVLVFCICMSSILPTGSRAYATEVSENTDKANVFEKTLTICVVFITAQVYVLIGNAVGDADGGQPLTIESLFFNNYSTTRLTIFDGMGSTNDYLSASIKDTVNDFFDFFTSIALIAYMMILVYIGIRVLLNAGTDKNAKYKEFFLYWVQGIAILFFFPYVMKYTIMINDAFVEFIDTNKENIYSIGDSFEHPGIKGDSGSLSDVTLSFVNVHDKFMAGTDYMSEMYRQAFQKGWLVYAICFVIMVKQLVGLIFLYFKRLLVTIFLIVIFPFVTVSYAIDKLGDGKSQVFGNWCKEFILNVFIQSFHAIVYVIGMAMILKLGNIGDNWLILIMLLTFISKGDELMKHVFNIQGSGAESIPTSMIKAFVQTKATIDLTKDVAGIANKTLGSESHLRKTAYGIGQFAGNARDNYINRNTYEEASAEVTQLSSNSSIPYQDTSDVNSPQTLLDAAAIALNESATEEERNQALDKILEVMNMEDSPEKEKALNELAEHFAKDPQKLKELEEMLKIRAAQNAIMIGGLTPVELSQQIDIILERLKGNGLAANMARNITKNNDLQKIKMAGMVNFKRPDESEFLNGVKGKKSNQKSGGTRKQGDRYSGTFSRRPASVVRREKALYKQERQRVFKQKVANAGLGLGSTTAGGAALGRSAPGAPTTEAARYRATSPNGGRTLGEIRADVKKTSNELRRLEKEGKRGTPVYQKVQAEYRKAKSKLEKKKSEKPRKRGAKAEQPTATYNDTTSSFAESKENKKIVKEQGKRRKEVYEKSGEYEKFEENRRKSASDRNTLTLDRGNRPGGRFKFGGNKTQAVGFGFNRASAKDAMNQGRSGGVTLKRAKTVPKPGSESSIPVKTTHKTQTKKNAQERTRNADARAEYASHGNPLSTHSELRQMRKEAKTLLRDARRTMGRADKSSPEYIQAKRKEEEILTSLDRLNQQERALNKNRSKMGESLRARGVVFSNTSRSENIGNGPMRRSNPEDTKIRVVEQASPRKMAEEKALKRTLESEQQPTSLFVGKFSEALGRDPRTSSDGPTHHNEGSNKINIFSKDIMEGAGKKKQEKYKIIIKDKHDSSVKTEEHALPASKGSTHSYERDTVIVIRDDSNASAVSTIGKNVVTLNSKKEYERAQQMVSDVKKRMEKEAKTTEQTSTPEKQVNQAKLDKNMISLAVSVTAINASNNGEYTASEIVSHIDNVKAIMASYEPDTEEYDACKKILNKLEYNLRDFESNVRIQVLNDPTLIADSDPNKSQIMDGSIRHVKKMKEDDILLSTLMYSPRDLKEDYMPMDKSRRSYQTIESLASSGIAIGAEARSIQRTMADALKEKELQERMQRAQEGMDASAGAMKENLKYIGKNALGATLDLTVNMPVSVTSAVVSAGMSSQTTIGAVTTGLSAYKIADKTIRTTRNAVGTGVNNIQSVISERLKSSSADSEEVVAPATETRETVNVAELRKAQLRGKTTLGSGESLSERARKNNNNS